MIKILVLKNNQNIHGLQASGHSGYAPAGQDIVCSAVSTLMQALIVGLTDVVKIKPKFEIDEDAPNITVRVEENNKDAQILMQTTYLALKQIY